MNILVFGANSQLGQCIRDAAKNSEDNYTFISHAEADIYDVKSVREVFGRTLPDITVNCAAYTNVDKAEIEQDNCFKANFYGAANIAIQCKLFESRLIQISTDYVYCDYDEHIPRKETDLIQPSSIYGISKWYADAAIFDFCQAMTIRTSWLYSQYGNNFFKTMKSLILSDRESISVVDDQIGRPTNANDLAKFIVDLISSRKFYIGAYNFQNSGEECSWYDFATEICKLISPESNKISRISTSKYAANNVNYLAKRPRYSVLDLTKIKNEFNIVPKDWKNSLEEFVSNYEIN